MIIAETMQEITATDAKDTDQAIGSALRSLREKQTMSARELAEQSGVSAAMISRIESGQVSPSISTMTSLCNTLNIPMVSLFRDVVSGHADFTHVKQGNGVVSTRLVDDHIHHYVKLAWHHRRDMTFEAHRVTLTPQDAKPPSYVGHGVVFIHVLAGSAKFKYGKQNLLLNKGDSLSIDAELTYQFIDILTPEFVFLSVQAESGH